MSPEPPAQAAPLVLVIDSDESILRLLNIKLTRAGFSVLTATDGEQGLAEARASAPDLIVLDGPLPGRDGFELVEELSLRRNGAQPGIVFLSALTSPSDIERALRRGCDDVVTKPFSPEEIVHRLRVVLLRRQLAAEADAAAGNPTT